ncbi:MAG: STAS-like domain-containing protein [Bacillota bacterium]
MVFKFGEVGLSLGTRLLGVEIREKLSKAINSSNDVIVLDFDGVAVVSNSFADECLGKLAQQMGINEFKTKTTFRNFNPFIGKVIKNAISNRIAMS